MEASFCLSPHPYLLLKSPYLPLSHSSYRINSPLTAKHYHVNSFHRSSLSINNGSISLRSNALLPITCHAAFDGVPIPHKKDERKNSYQNLITKAAATVVFTCALGMMLGSSNAKAIIPSNIQKLMIMNQMNSSSSQGGGGGGGGGKKSTQRANMREIKKEVSALADKGDLEKAVTYLTELTYENEEDKHLIGILLVDMLSRQGKYKEALGQECLSTIANPKSNVGPSKTQINLYKTCLYLMEGDYARAKVWCKALLKNPPRDSAGQTPHFMESDDHSTDE